MTTKHLSVAGTLALLAALTACGTGSPFTPLSGPFEGQFVVDGDSIGSFSLTMQDTLVAGSGTLTHLGESQPVSISGNRSGKSFTGTVRNEELGFGNLVGQFIDMSHCEGTFNYTDTAQTELVTGSWTAEVP